jgi:hypothetical protein
MTSARQDNETTQQRDLQLLQGQLQIALLWQNRAGGASCWISTPVRIAKEPRPRRLWSIHHCHRTEYMKLHAKKLVGDVTKRLPPCLRKKPALSCALLLRTAVSNCSLRPSRPRSKLRAMWRPSMRLSMQPDHRHLRRNRCCPGSCRYAVQPNLGWPA